MGLGEEFTGPGRWWQALFGRKLLPSLAGACWPAGHQHTLPCSPARAGGGCCCTPAPEEQQAGWVGGHKAQTSPDTQPGEEATIAVCRMAAGLLRAGLGLQPHTLSRQRGRWGRVWKGPGGLVLTCSWPCQEHSCPDTELPGSWAPAEHGSSPAVTDPPRLQPPHSCSHHAAWLGGRRPSLGLLGPASGHGRSHPGWSQARSCKERGRSKGKG